MLDYGYGDPVERWQAEREDEEFERRHWILHGRCPACGGSGHRCCEFGADVLPPDDGDRELDTDLRCPSASQTPAVAMAQAAGVSETLKEAA